MKNRKEQLTFFGRKKTLLTTLKSLYEQKKFHELIELPLTGISNLPFKFQFEIYILLAESYFFLDHLEESDDFQLKALEILALWDRQIPQENFEHHLEINVLLGLCYLLSNNYEESISHFEKAIAVFKQAPQALKNQPNSQLKHTTASAYYHLGEVHRREGRYVDALAASSTALIYYQELKDEHKEILALLQKGSLHNLLEQYNEAHVLLNLAKSISTKCSNNQSLIAHVNHQLSISLSKQGKADEANFSISWEDRHPERSEESPRSGSRPLSGNPSLRS